MKSCSLLRVIFLFAASVLIFSSHLCVKEISAEDHLSNLQKSAITAGKSGFGHWGPDADDYIAWGSHSNRLIPVYTFGTLNTRGDLDLRYFSGRWSPYRSQAALRRLYGRVPTNTLNEQAEYFDQTNIADLQFRALQAKKKHIFLVIFDGMDWQTTLAAATYKMGKVPYTSGRGTGLHFQDETAKGTSQFGYMVTAPRDASTIGDVNTQRIKQTTLGLPGGYNVAKGGPNPWTAGNDRHYLIGRAANGPGEHAYVDSAASATAMSSGVRTYNGSINIDWTGAALPTVAHKAQDLGYKVGLVTSVPISHATPASMYAHNVTRNDYQDITRDLLGLPSIFHPKQKELPGVDVLIGTGFDVDKKVDLSQGQNFVSGNRYLTDADLKKIDTKNGGKYVVSVRESGKAGKTKLLEDAATALKYNKRLFGYYGAGNGTAHLPYQTANGDYQPTLGRTRKAEKYSPADIQENPTLADMTTAAINVLSPNPQGFWLMVEAGDVDWANHDNNIDNSIGAVFSGDAAVKTITDWVEKNSNWEESVMIVTADHGHYLILDRPELLVDPDRQKLGPQTPGMVPELAGDIMPPRLMADGGLAELAPENTLAAISAALDLKLDLRLDVSVSKDRQLVLFRDETLHRTTNGKRAVADMTLKELKTLDAGSWFHPDYKNERIPTLKEAFDYIKKNQKRPTRIALNIRSTRSGTEFLVAREIQQQRMLEQVFCLCPDADGHQSLKRSNNDVQTAVTAASHKWDLQKLDDWKAAVVDQSTAQLWVDFLPTDEQLQIAATSGKPVWLFLKNDAELHHKAALSRVTGLCTNRAGIMRRLQQQQIQEFIKSTEKTAEKSK